MGATDSMDISNTTVVQNQLTYSPEDFHKIWVSEYGEYGSNSEENGSNIFTLPRKKSSIRFLKLYNVTICEVFVSD